MDADDSDDLGGGHAPQSATRSATAQHVNDIIVIDANEDDPDGRRARALPVALKQEASSAHLAPAHSASTAVKQSTSTDRTLHADHKVQHKIRRLDPSTDPDVEDFRHAPQKRRHKKDAVIVGRTGPRKTKVARRTTDSDEHDALSIGTLPSYFKTRRSDFDNQREKRPVDILRLPPQYDDIYFSDSDRLDQVAERPQIPDKSPPNPYEDIELPKSVGIIPAPIAQWLRDYQVEGAAFMHQAFVYQKGVILGDDMGLGKTIQVISFLTAAFGKTGDARDAKRMRKVRRADDNRWYPRVLIVCPSGLLLNWQNELDKWGWWTTYRYHGTTKHDALEAARSGRLEIMLTSYDTYSHDTDAINEVEWDCVIADECHRVSNNKAQRTEAIMIVNALCRIGLTGTAIQNNYEELWTLLNWANPGAVGDRRGWKSSISDPLKAGQSFNATNAQLAKARTTAQDLVKHVLPHYFLRRMKNVIASELTKKSDKVVFCPMTDVQQAAYDNLCGSELCQAIINASKPCHCGSGKTQGRCCFDSVDGVDIKTAIFPALQTLQKMSNHLALLVPSSEEDPDKLDRALEFMKTAIPKDWQKMYSKRDSVENYANQDYCGKWKVLKKMLKLWHDNGDKVLIFSHSVRLLRMLHTLFKVSTSYTMSYLDGSMTGDGRQREVDSFNADPSKFVFLISTKAGGVGLNITSANKVVVVDPHWNPSWDLQAQDRAYRFGQIRDVDVFRLVSAGTVEENIYARQIYKQQQANIGYNASAERRYFEGVQGAENKGELFGWANLLAPINDRVALQAIVNKTNIAETRAGVKIAGLDLEVSQEAATDDEDYDQDKAIADLADAIIGGGEPRRPGVERSGKKKDGITAIQAILDSAGVSYTHENAQVIGSSKIEMQISSRARKAGGDSDWNRERVFAGSQSQDVPNSKGFAYKYNPPKDVRMRQFCSMAKFFGYDDVYEFALEMESCTQQQRRNYLDRFYSWRREVLSADRMSDEG